MSAKRLAVTHKKLRVISLSVHLSYTFASASSPTQVGDIEIESLTGMAIRINIVHKEMGMATSPTNVMRVVKDLMHKWEATCPETTFFGHTLEQFKAGVQASLDARAALEALGQQRKVLLERRHTADQASLYLMKGVINAIKGDPTQGEDGELYGALGYVRSSMRVNGRSRVRANGHAQMPAAATAGDAPAKAQEEKTDNKAA